MLPFFALTDPLSEAVVKDCLQRLHLVAEREENDNQPLQVRNLTTASSDKNVSKVTCIIAKGISIKAVNRNRKVNLS